MGDSIPDLALFKQFASQADTSTLHRMSKIIASRLNAARKHVKLESSDSRIPQRIESPKEAFGLLLEDKWSDLFTRYQSKEKDYYVYMHASPRGGERKYLYSDIVYVLRKPFYVGMGQGNRLFGKNRSVMHKKAIDDLLALGHVETDFMLLFKEHMTEADARELESKLILFFGVRTAFGITNTAAKKNALSGSRPCLLNNRYEPIPDRWASYAC